jgi:SHS2 domain-containing protein
MAFSYRFLDDIALADLAFEVSGDSLPDIFQGATNALIEAMADPATVGTTWTQQVHRQEGDPAALLFDWLSDLVYWKDAASVVFSRAVLKLQDEAGVLRLDATLFGERVNPEVQILRADVKGVTKHLYDVSRAGERWKARVVVDV